MSLCLYVSMSLCPYVSMFLCLYVSVSLCLYVSMCLCLYASMPLCLYMPVYLYVCMSVCLCLSVCMYRWGADLCPKSTDAGLQSAVLFPCVFFAHCEHAKYWYYLRLVAFLRLPKTVPKSPFEAYLKDILRNLQCFERLIETATSRKTLQEHQNNPTLNKP